MSIYSSHLTPNHSSMENLSRLIVEHLEQKEQLYQAVNKLVNELHHTQMLLEENKSKEALLKVEELVHYGENISRQF
ncbi:hypothetical protein [Crocosphaera sp.]|uniref:hypothetical protein n=1 Tax=Crocosphaera sp. TaxID=2729996 RepID=UPI00260312BB|nr:hypothetical protein [Crocosphaera sp.]MDJ0579736.1 hypothetical protein [Crocosphaera sp.]